MVQVLYVHGDTGVGKSYYRTEVENMLEAGRHVPEFFFSLYGQGDIPLRKRQKTALVLYKIGFVKRGDPILIRIMTELIMSKHEYIMIETFQSYESFQQSMGKNQRSRMNRVTWRQELKDTRESAREYILAMLNFFPTNLTMKEKLAFVDKVTMLEKHGGPKPEWRRLKEEADAQYERRSKRRVEEIEKWLEDVDKNFKMKRVEDSQIVAYTDSQIGIRSEKMTSADVRNDVVAPKWMRD